MHFGALASDQTPSSQESWPSPPRTLCTECVMFACVLSGARGKADWACLRKAATRSGLMERAGAEFCEQREWRNWVCPRLADFRDSPSDPGGCTEASRVGRASWRQGKGAAGWQGPEVRAVWMGGSVCRKGAPGGSGMLGQDPGLNSHFSTNLLGFWTNAVRL